MKRTNSFANMPAQTPAPRQDAATAQAMQASPAQAPSPRQDAATAQAPPTQTAAPPQSAVMAQVMQSPHAQTSAAPEPQSHGQSDPKDTDMDGDDDDDPNNLSHNEKLAIIRAISNAPEEPAQFQQAFEHSLPFPIDFKIVQALIHPDKYQDKEKDQAKVAFQSMCPI